MCIFLKVDPTPIPELLYTCALSDDPDLPALSNDDGETGQDHAPCHLAQRRLPLQPTQPCAASQTIQCSALLQSRHASKHVKRFSMSTLTGPELCGAQAREQLQDKPDAAETVFAAPYALWSSTAHKLAELFERLPEALRSVAARGYFGAKAVEWRLSFKDDDAALSLSNLTAQQLPHQPRVTAVHISGPVGGEQSVQCMRILAHATQLTAISIDGGGREDSPTRWLQQLTPLTRLLSLTAHSCNLRGQHLPSMVAGLRQLPSLTQLALEGCGKYEYGPGGEKIDDEGFAEFAPALAHLTRLARLELPRLLLGPASTRALGPVLAGMFSTLRFLSLYRTDAMDANDAVAHGLVACAALTYLDLTRCKLEACLMLQSERAWHGMQAQLQTLILDQNVRLSVKDSAGLKAMLAAPALRSLTHLSLKHVYMDEMSVHKGWYETEHAWAWEEVCALTALSELNLQGNYLGEIGAAVLAKHIGSLVQLQLLNIADCGVESGAALARKVFRLPKLKRLVCHQVGGDGVWSTMPEVAYVHGLRIELGAD